MAMNDSMVRLDIRPDDLRGPEVVALLREHYRNMLEITPAGSAHVLDIASLRQASDITFWTVWIDEELAGCGALRELSSEHGEIKSMKTADQFTRKGVASRLLEHMLAEACARSFKRVSLETGSFPAFAPARALYEKYGFTYCEPFRPYRQDGNNVFMTRKFEQKESSAKRSVDNR
jgi:putative acetyltransferase